MRKCRMRMHPSHGSQLAEIASRVVHHPVQADALDETPHEVDVGVVKKAVLSDGYRGVLVLEGFDKDVDAGQETRGRNKTVQ